MKYVRLERVYKILGIIGDNTAMKKINAIIAFVVLSFCLNAVLGQQLITEYNFENASQAAQEIRISQGFLTIVDFPDLIEQVSSGNADIIEVEVNEDRLMLRPTRKAGNTDLLVTVGTDTTMFSIVIDARNKASRRYILKTAEQQDEERRIAEAENARAIAQAEADARAASLLASQQAQQTATTVANNPSTTVAMQQISVVDTVNFQINSVTTGANDTLVISYVLENSGSQQIDLHTLTFVSGGRTLASYESSINPFTQSADGGYIPAGTSEYGTIVVYSAPASGSMNYTGVVLELSDSGENTHAISNTINY